MQRTTVMADDALMERLREIARREGVSLAEVIREGMRWRAQQKRRLRLVGAVSGDQPTAVADEADQLRPEPRPWR